MSASSGLRRVLEACGLLVVDCKNDVSCMFEDQYEFVQGLRFESKVVEWVEAGVHS